MENQNETVKTMVENEVITSPIVFAVREAVKKEEKQKVREELLKYKEQAEATINRLNKENTEVNTILEEVQRLWKDDHTKHLEVLKVWRADKERMQYNLDELEKRNTYLNEVTTTMVWDHDEAEKRLRNEVSALKLEITKIKEENSAKILALQSEIDSVTSCNQKLTAANHLQNVEIEQFVERIVQLENSGSELSALKQNVHEMKAKYQQQLIFKNAEFEKFEKAQKAKITDLTEQLEKVTVAGEKRYNETLSLRKKLEERRELFEQEQEDHEGIKQSLESTVESLKAEMEDVKLTYKDRIQQLVCQKENLEKKMIKDDAKVQQERQWLKNGFEQLKKLQDEKVHQAVEKSEKLEAQLKDQKDKCEILQKKFEELAASNKSLELEMKRQEVISDDLKDAIDDIMKERDNFSEQFYTTKDKYQKMKEEVTAHRAFRKEEQQAQTTLNEKMMVQLAELQDKYNKEVATSKRLSEELKGVSNQRDKFKSDAERWHSEIDARETVLVNEKISTIETLKHYYTRELETAKYNSILANNQTTIKYNMEIEVEKKKLAHANMELELAKASLRSSNDTIGELHTQVAVLDDKRKNLTDSVSQYHLANDSLKSTVRQMQEELERREEAHAEQIHAMQEEHRTLMENHGVETFDEEESDEDEEDDDDEEEEESDDEEAEEAEKTGEWELVDEDEQ